MVLNPEVKSFALVPLTDQMLLTQLSDVLVDSTEKLILAAQMKLVDLRFWPFIPKI